MDIIKIKYQKVLDSIKKIYYFNNILYLKKYNILFSNILKIKNFNILNYKFIRKKFIINNFIYIKIIMKKEYKIFDGTEYSGKYNKYSSDSIDIGVYDNNNYRYYEYDFFYSYNIFINNKLNYNIKNLIYKYKGKSNNFFEEFYLMNFLHYYNLTKIFYKQYNKNYNIINIIKNQNFRFVKYPKYENNIYYRDYKNRRRNNNHKNLDIDLLIKDKINLNKRICYNTYINFYNDYIYCDIFKNNYKITSKSFYIKKFINMCDETCYCDYYGILCLFNIKFKYKKFKIYLNIQHGYFKYDERYLTNKNFSNNCYNVYMKNKNKIKFNLNNKLIKILI